MNKFEKLSSRGHQMSLSGGGLGAGGGGKGEGVPVQGSWGQEGSCTVRSKLNKFKLVGGGCTCMVKSNVLWVMVTWVPL